MPLLPPDPLSIISMGKAHRNNMGGEARDWEGQSVSEKLTLISY
jgi:hypothetical protein